jgi:hypothetical protein
MKSTVTLRRSEPSIGASNSLNNSMIPALLTRELSARPLPLPVKTQVT